MSYLLLALSLLLGGEKVVYGMLTEAERDERYEQPCHLVCRIMGGETALAYHAAVTDSTGHKTYFWFFALEGSTIPQVGQVGHWTLHRTQIYEFWRCTSYACPSFPDWTLDRLEDVTP